MVAVYNVRFILDDFPTILDDNLSDLEGTAPVLGIVTVADVVEAARGILAGVIEQHLHAAGVVFKELGDIVHYVVDDDGRVVPAAALLDLLARKELHD